MSRIVGAITRHPIAAVVIVLVLTAGIGFGAGDVEQSTSLDQFQSDTEAAQKLDFIRTEFAGRDANTTTAQIIVRDDNVLTQEALVAMLRYQQDVRDNATIAPTLVETRSTTGIANVIATAAIRQEQVAELEAMAADLQALNASIQAERAAIESRGQTLNGTADRLQGALTHLRQNPNASIQAAFESVRANTTVTLNQTDAGIFDRAARQLRNATSQEEATAAYELGTRGVLADEYRELERRSTALQDDVSRLQSQAAELETQRQALEDAAPPTLDEQIAQLESMNASAIDDVIRTVLAGDGQASNQVFAFMPTGYDPGSTEVSATMLFVTQVSETSGAGGQAASEAVVDAQLAMQAIGQRGGGDLEYLVFGSGVINNEITASMNDSLTLVAPLALLFVLLALTIAYRDILDIILGLLGIGVVLLWTFGFMGWADIAFNQIFVAVPVLLIGLSIDYAIHIFMRHREERAVGEGLGPRGSMRIALGGVGIALVLVTATTVIGFLSNLVSPVPPIREFGLVSSAGIIAALVVFGVLTPALKVLLDELLEGVGIDRQKRAFGTGGGAFSSILAVGASAARRAPWAVVFLVLLISAGGVYGATQVDTSFNQEDFLAEDPPEWMTELPEPFAPSDYTAKENLQYVNENFLRRDSQAQLLVEGSITTDDTLERLQTARSTVADQPFTQRLSNGEADINSPLSVIRSVAATNESFNATVAAADTDGDGIPDRDLQSVYDRLFAVAPDRAAGVIARSDGEYTALRMVVSIQGGADSETVTTELQSIADSLDGDGLEATATGQVILFEIVQTDLLETVIESLIITLIAVFIFLMIVYRISDGSASLGAVTVVPVLLSVTWILGTMYLLDIPFNVLTGMITSLTVGLGVAYSIHLSERYSQELERTGAVWTALERAVTGTGGALLGSAATTIGGFGVLAFAVLPPLQQFGIITGLTIAYAFLASVLVLPSLLVIWTRYLGPPEHRPAAARGTDAVGPGVGAHRSPETRYVLPGETMSVTVTVGSSDRRTLLSELIDGAVADLESASPSPAASGTTQDALFVAWDSLPEGGSVTYQVQVPTDPATSAIHVEGEVDTAAGTATIEGPTQLSIVSDVFERAVATDGVSAADLERAGQDLSAGALTSDQFETLSRAWLRDERPGQTQEDDSDA